MSHPVILFDGVCNLCNSSVQFVIRNDPSGHFRFAALQSDFARDQLKKFQVADGLDSIVLIEDGVLYTRSTAALRVSRHLRGWSWLYAFRWVPRFLRDAVYNLIARHRYRLFGRQQECMLPTPELRARFIN
ncbi:MAG: thiol-disulfide oxidoreductase DCC family protein [Cyclobacteriaceae bacterium]|jgi:predicted DCC family thiol-disulfide oxidoreductase YuxK